MRSDAFIHFVCDSQRVNIRLGVLLFIPESIHVTGDSVFFLNGIF